MRHGSSGIIALGAIIAAATAPPVRAATPVALQPSGKWVIDFAERACIMSRSYGADGAITVAFRPWPLGESTQLLMMSPGYAPSPGEIDDGSVMIGAGGPRQRLHYQAWRDAKTGHRMVSMNVSQQDLAKLAEGDTITLSAGAKPVTFAPLGLARAQKVLDECQDNLLKTWGVDPAERAGVVTPATGADTGEWLSSDDYPASAISNGSIGDTTILYSIGVDGRVGDCRVVGSSGTPVLDAAVCKAMKQRGRFNPALNAAGKPVVTHATRRVNWRMP